MALPVHHELIKQNITLATAESCTGGALAAAFVANAGCSAYFQGSIVAYANSVKVNLLHVDPKLLEEKGAVSQEVTDQMALGVCSKLNADLGIAVSGILGPEGGTKETPVGTICASIAYKGKVVASWTMHLQGSRQEVSEKVVQELLAKTHLFLIKNQG